MCLFVDGKKFTGHGLQINKFKKYFSYKFRDRIYSFGNDAKTKILRIQLYRYA